MLARCPRTRSQGRTNRVTRASLDHPPHNVAAMFDQVADR
jgi:hypothetical protein